MVLNPDVPDVLHPQHRVKATNLRIFVYTERETKVENEFEHQD
jgi:hypothetical protein